MFDIDTKGDLQAMRALLDETLKQIAPAKQVVVIKADIATMSCKALVQRVIRERGEQASATFHTKLGAELARRGKQRALLQRAVRNGNGNGSNGAD